MERQKVQAVVTDLLGKLRSSQLTKSQALVAINELKSQFSDFDYDYVCAMLFPENNPPARLPSKFSLPTAMLTQRFTAYISTGSYGNGFVTFLPQDTSYRCLYKSDPAVDFSNLSGFLPSCLTVPESDSTYIPANYSQVRLLGASIRMQYIGVAQEESGIINASHVYESEVGRLSDEIIDNGYFNVRGRPFEGVRMVWLPKDATDFELYDTNLKIVNTDTTPSDDFVPYTDVQRPDLTGKFRVAYNQGQEGWTIPEGDKYTTAGQVWGIGAKRRQQSHPSQIVISYRGMPTNKLWWRIDVERHFEGTPRTAIRDIVAVGRTNSNEKSLDAVKNISSCGYLFGHKVTEAKRIESHFKNKMGDVLYSLSDGNNKYMDHEFIPDGDQADRIGAMPYSDALVQGMNIVNPQQQLTPNQYGPQRSSAQSMYDGDFM